MCGIIGIATLQKEKLGELLYSTLLSLQHRGFDSTGVAVYSKDNNEPNAYKFIIEVLDVVGAMSKVSTSIASVGGDIRNITMNTVRNISFDKYVIRISNDKYKEIAEKINSTKVAKVLSIGRYMEIFKATLNVKEFDKAFNLRNFRGTHGLGHVRFSTESNTFIAASEEVAIRYALPHASIKYVRPGGVLVWELRKNSQ